MEDTVSIRLERDDALALLRQLLEDDPVVARDVWLRVAQRPRGGDLILALVRETGDCLQRCTSPGAHLLESER